MCTTNSFVNGRAMQGCLQRQHVGGQGRGHGQITLMLMSRQRQIHYDATAV